MFVSFAFWTQYLSTLWAPVLWNNMCGLSYDHGRLHISHMCEYRKMVKARNVDTALDVI